MKVLRAAMGKTAEAVGNDDYVVTDEIREIRSSSFPFMQRRFAFAALFQFAAQDWTSRSKINFLIERIGGSVVNDITFDMVPAQMFGHFKPRMPVVVSGENIEFVEPGNYRFAITINGKVAREVPFKLIAVTADGEEYEFESGLKVIMSATCRRAEVDSTNTRMHLEGLHFQTGAANFPLKIPALDVATFFQIPPFWQGKQMYFRAAVLDSDGREITHLGQEMMAPGEQGALTIIAPIVMPFRNLTVSKPQMLQVEIRIENEIKWRFPYEVLHFES